MTDRVHVGSTDEIPEGDRKIVSVNGTPVGIFNVDGDYYAIENECAHQGGPVCTGKLQGALTGEFVESGELVDETYTDVPALACPWHGWEYDVRTGDHLGHPEISLATFDVTIEDDELYVEV